MKKYLILILGVGVLASSCYKKLEITPPNAIINEQVYEVVTTGTPSQVDNLLNGASRAMVQILMNKANGTGSAENRTQYLSGLHTIRNFQGNDIVYSAQDRSYGATDAGALYTMNNTFTSQAAFNVEFYRYYYQVIADANKVLGFITDELWAAASDANKPIIRSYQARAYVIRAYCYNMLAETYVKAAALGGGSDKCVPIYTTFNPNQDYQPASTLDQVYTFILGDLQKAIDGFTTTKISAKNADDLDASVALFIRARVYLCMGRYEDAISDCNTLIAAFPDLMTEKQYVAQGEDATDTGGYPVKRYYARNSGFLNLKQNPEAIFGWPSSVAGNSHTGWFNTMGNGAGGARACNAQIDSRLYQAMDSRDYRQDNFIGYYDITKDEENRPYYHLYASTKGRIFILPYSNLKFASTIGTTVTGSWTDALENSSANTVDYTMMRISEVYLMKAEAEALNGASPGATLDNLLAARTRSGETTMTYANYAWPSYVTTDIDKVRLQWRIEMWGENGLDFFNSRRWDGVNRQTNGPTNHYFTSAVWTPEYMTVALPDNALIYNQNL